MAEQPSQHTAYLLFDDAELHYDFGAQHPLNPGRLRALTDLLACSNLWRKDNQPSVSLRPATTGELQLVHTPEYVAAVQHLSQPPQDVHDEQEGRERALLTLHYGFGDGDTPAVLGMHDAAARLAGGTLMAMSMVMGLPEGGSLGNSGERPLHVFHPAGGLHHAWAERASGFCIYNDLSVAIAHVLRSTDAKVLYLDFDAHHGDGVQRSFYDESRVMTISLHETGRYLFPGTGDVLETGNGSGRGYSVNIPLEPFTEDDSYIEVMEALLSPLVTSFAPDIILTQHGCDTHAWDPLTHLSLTLRGIQAQIRMAHHLAHTYCSGRWVAVGGGGYDLYRVVPRAWSLVWAEMSEQTVPEHLPGAWVERWRPQWIAQQQQEEEAQEVMGKPGTAAFPVTFMDRREDFPAQPRRIAISAVNRHSAALVRHLLIPPSVRQAFPAARRRSPLVDLFDLLHLNREGAPSRSKPLPTARGPVLLRDFCPPSFVERLRADSGLKTFARLPEREHQLLLNIAKSPDCALTLAYTTTGEIIGEVTIAPADEWWEGIENVYEVAIEVSTNWREMGIARAMLAFALELDALEDMILFAIGLSWHWDVEGLGISVYRYRELLSRLFATQGFSEYPTTEPNVSMEPANVLLVRIGKRVDKRIAGQFLTRLLSSPNLSQL